MQIFVAVVAEMIQRKKKKEKRERERGKKDGRKLKAERNFCLEFGGKFPTFRLVEC